MRISTLTMRDQLYSRTQIRKIFLACFPWKVGSMNPNWLAICYLSWMETYHSHQRRIWLQLHPSSNLELAIYIFPVQRYPRAAGDMFAHWDEHFSPQSRSRWLTYLRVMYTVLRLESIVDKSLNQGCLTNTWVSQQYYFEAALAGIGIGYWTHGLLISSIIKYTPLWDQHQTLFS